MTEVQKVGKMLTAGNPGSLNAMFAITFEKWTQDIASHLNGVYDCKLISTGPFKAIFALKAGMNVLKLRIIYEGSKVAVEIFDEKNKKGAGSEGYELAHQSGNDIANNIINNVDRYLKDPKTFLTRTLPLN